MSQTNDSGKPSSTAFSAGAAVLIVTAFVCGYLLAQGQRVAITPPTVTGFVWPPPPPVEHLALIDTSGSVLDETALNAHWTLVFFGYTHCPDICPTTMYTLKQVREKLAGYRAFESRGQVLFVSVDGARDTPEVLRAYTDFFNPEFLAAAVPGDELYRLTEQFGVQVTKTSGDTAGEYYFDHPAYVLLVGPDNRVTGVFTPPLDPADIARQVREIIDWGERRG